MQLIRRLVSFRVSNPILSGLCQAFVWMFIGAFILSLFLWMSGMREQDLSLYTYVVRMACHYWLVVLSQANVLVKKDSTAEGLPESYMDSCAVDRISRAGCFV